MKVMIPSPFQIAPFFTKTCVDYEITTFPNMLRHSYFVYELLKLNEVETYEPWCDTEVAIGAVIRIWKEEKDEIAQLFRLRNRTAAEPFMIRFTAHYISVLYWLQDGYIESLEGLESQLEQLQMKPVNVSERLSFVVKQPGHYHSFIQLTQLYEEFEKLFVKKILMQKRPR